VYKFCLGEGIEKYSKKIQQEINKRYGCNIMVIESNDDEGSDDEENRISFPVIFLNQIDQPYLLKISQELKIPLNVLKQYRVKEPMQYPLTCLNSNLSEEEKEMVVLTMDVDPEGEVFCDIRPTGFYDPLAEYFYAPPKEHSSPTISFVESKQSFFATTMITQPIGKDSYSKSF
jgi:hypothetical protein